MLEITLVNAAHSSRLDRVKQMFNYFKDLSCYKIHVTKNKDNINFPTYDFDIIENDGNWVERLHAAFQMVKTPYVMMIDEDDIYNFDYISNSINFLNQNINYVATWGMVFSSNNKKIYIQPSDAMIYSNQIKQNYSTTNRIDSIIYYLTYGNNFTLHHNVIRSNIFKKLYSFLNDNVNYHSVGYTDRIGILTVSAFGNIKTLDCIHNIKDRTPNEKIRNCPTEKYLEVKPWTSFYKENTNFCKFLSKESKIDFNSLKTAIDKTISVGNPRRFEYNLDELNKNMNLANFMLNKYYC